jgi:hypothetical protein
MTHSDGWRRQTGYHRQGATFRWDYAFDENTTLKTIVAYTGVEQQTGAYSALGVDDFCNTPRRNLFSIAYREVEALRISSAFEKTWGTPACRSHPIFAGIRWTSAGLSICPTMRAWKSLARPAAIPRARVAETVRKAISYHFLSLQKED